MEHPNKRSSKDRDDPSMDPKGLGPSVDPLQFIAHHLEKGASRDAWSDFLEYFGFIRDPFDPILLFQHLKDIYVVSARQAPLFEHVGRIIENYRKRLQSSRFRDESNKSIHALIRGPMGAGKTVLLKVLELSLPKTRHVPRLKPAFLDLHELIGTTTLSDDARVRWQRWLADVDREMDQVDRSFEGMVIFVDGMEFLLSSRSPLGTLQSLSWMIRDVFDFEPLFIGTMRTCVFHWILARNDGESSSLVHETILKFIDSGNMLRIPLLTASDLVELLKRRLDYCSSSVASWVSSEALMLMSHYSAGLPGIALELLKLSLNHLKELGSRRLLPRHVQFVAKQHGFLDTSTMSKDSLDWRDLSDRQKQVLFLLLQREAWKYLVTTVNIRLNEDISVVEHLEGYTNKQIALHLGINLSTLTYHLKPLIHGAERSSFLITRRNDDDNRSKVHFLQPRAIPVVEALIDGSLESSLEHHVQADASHLNTSPRPFFKK